MGEDGRVDGRINFVCRLNGYETLLVGLLTVYKKKNFMFYVPLGFTVYISVGYIRMSLGGSCTDPSHVNENRFTSDR